MGLTLPTIQRELGSSFSGSEADQSHPSIAEVKEWSYASASIPQGTRLLNLLTLLEANEQNRLSRHQSS